MVEFTIGQGQYRAGKLDARRQFHVARRIAPLVGQLQMLAPALAGKNIEEMSEAETARAFEQALIPFTEELSKMSDADCDYVLDACLSVVQRQQQGGGWQAIWNPRAGRMQFEDINVSEMMQIAGQVIMDSLGGFFATSPATAQMSAAGPGPTLVASNG